MTMKSTRPVRALVAALLLTFATPAAASGDRGTAEEAQAMVARAIAHYDEMGAEAALARFNADPAPEFLDRDLYIFVYGPEDAIVAHGVDPSLLGRTYSSFTDVDGKRFGEEMRRTASADGTWVDYKWINPATGEVEQKSSWLVLHDGHLFGVSIYKP
ncbi:MAG: cache domain-containing protein [Alphaproteobacteria bacterium]|nr:cache domain-containing protein [Alphaproteobacteria bacterium]